MPRPATWRWMRVLKQGRSGGAEHDDRVQACLRVRRMPKAQATSMDKACRLSSLMPP